MAFSSHYPPSEPRGGRQGKERPGAEPRKNLRGAEARIPWTGIRPRGYGKHAEGRWPWRDDYGETSRRL